MANVYSTLFVDNGAVPSGLSSLYTVPSGYRAVVRDVTYINGTGFPRILGTFALFSTATFAVITEVTAGYVHSGRLYHWEGHSVINTGDGLYCQAADTGWRLRVSGYLLTLP